MKPITIRYLSGHDVAPLDRDRPLAADVELILDHFTRPAFIDLFR